MGPLACHKVNLILYLALIFMGAPMVDGVKSLLEGEL
jgi:hypothetical protein